MLGVHRRGPEHLLICEFAQTVLDWESDHSIKVRISRTPLTDHYEQKFCVKALVDLRSI